MRWKFGLGFLPQLEGSIFNAIDILHRSKEVIYLFRVRDRMQTTGQIPEAKMRLLLTEVPTVLSADGAVHALLGFDREEFLCSTVTLGKRIHSDDADIAAMLFSPKKSILDRTFNVRIRHADGRIRCLKGNYCQQTRDDGQVILDLFLQDAKCFPKDVGPQVGIPPFEGNLENTDQFLYFKNLNHVYTQTSRIEHGADLVGQTDYDLFPEERADIYYRLEKKLFAGSSVGRAILETQGKEGERGWAANYKYAILDSERKIVGLWGIEIDVTRQMYAEEALRKSEAQYRILLDFASDGILILDNLYRFVEVNASICRMLGYSRDELLSLSISDVVVSDNFTRIVQEAALLSCGRPTRIDWLFTSKDGSHFLVEVSANRLPDGRILATVRDVSEQRRVEFELRRSESSLAAAEARSHLGSWELDLASMLGHWSAETSRLYYRDPFGGPLTFGEFLELIHPEDRAKCENAFRKILDESNPFEFEYRTNPESGPIRLLSTTAYLIRDTQGAAVRMEGTTLDITERRRTEEALRDSDASLLDAQVTAGLGRYVLDVASGTWTSSLELDDLFGIDASYERTVAGWMALIHPEDRDLIEACIARSHLGNSAHFDDEYRVIRHCDGELRWVHGISRPEFNAQGHLVRKVGTTQNITYRKLAEISLRESEESLKEAQRIAGLGSYVFDISSGIWTSSEVLDEVFGIPKCEERRVAEWFDIIHHDHRAMMAAYLNDEVLGEGKPFDKEFRFIRQCDRAERWAHGTGKLELDARGKPSKMRGAIQDITERKLVELALQESQKLLELFIEHAPVSLSMFDREMRYLAASRRYLETKSLLKEQVTGHLQYEVVPYLPEDWRRAHYRAMAGETIRRDDDRLELPDGSVQWRKWEVLPWRTGDGEIGGIVIFTEDITAQKLAEQKLRESKEQLGLFIEYAPAALAMFDHEMRYLSVSRRWLEDYGLSDLEIIGACQYDIFPAISERWKDIHRRGLAGETIRENEDVFERADGTAMWLRWEVRPWRLADGAVGGILTFSEDITQSKLAEERLRLAATVFTHAREGILITDPDGAILDVNEAFSLITGYSRDEVLGSNPRIFSSGLQSNEFYERMWRDLKEKGQWYGEIWNRKKNGEPFAALQTISRLSDARGRVTQFLQIFSDITQMKENEKKLEHIAHFDLLTGMPNRVLLGDRMHQGMIQSHRRGQMLAVAYLDLDGFKGVNDRHGHEAGDHLLATLATRMKLALREGDSLARLGGDEFVAVLIDLPNTDACLPEISRLLEAAASSVPYNGLELRVSASLGVTFYPQNEEVDADQLLRQADQAMYQAKLAGRNRYHIFDSSQDRTIRGHHEDLEQIRHALAGNEFVLYYQPKVNMATGDVLGAEALIRWQHPERGLLDPGVFLPIIEDHPLSVNLGEWVIATALTQMELWKATGLDIAVSVNICAYHLQKTDFVDRLRDLLGAHPEVPPSRLELEVLETSALQDVSQVSKAIVDCRTIGVSVALDDFGTGYSSLAYLKRLPANVLKIDQSFIRDMLENSDDLAILEGVLGLAIAFHRQVIAEGVETAGQGVMLLQLGCELAQGYYIARPMPSGDLPKWIANWGPAPLWTGVSAIGANNWSVLHAGVELRAWIAAVENELAERPNVWTKMDEHRRRFGDWLEAERAGPRARLPAFKALELLFRSLQELLMEAAELRSKGRLGNEVSFVEQLRALRDQILEQLSNLTIRTPNN